MNSHGTETKRKIKENEDNKYSFTFDFFLGIQQLTKD